MTPVHIAPKQSGTKHWLVVTADTSHELHQAAEKTGTEIRQKGNQPPHLDLNPKQVKRINDAG